MMKTELIDKYLLKDAEEKQIAEGLFSKSKKSPNLSTYSKLGKRLSARYMQADSQDKKTDIAAAISLTCLAAITQNKGLSSRALKIATGTE